MLRHQDARTAPPVLHTLPSEPVDSCSAFVRHHQARCLATPCQWLASSDPAACAERGCFRPMNAHVARTREQTLTRLVTPPSGNLIRPCGARPPGASR